MAWSIKSNFPLYLNNAAACGSRTSCLSIGGYTLYGNINNCYIWNGSSWSTFTTFIHPSQGGGSIQANSSHQAVGTVSSVLVVGGAVNGHYTYKFVGAAWYTANHNIIQPGSITGGKPFAAMVGCPTNATTVNGSSGGIAATTRWTGASWSSGPTISYVCELATVSAGGPAGQFGNGTGGQGYVSGGGVISPGPPVQNTAYFNGTSWITKPNMTYKRYKCGNSSAGNLTEGLVWGGTIQLGSGPITSHHASTEYWNGVSWNTRGDMVSGRDYAAGCGTSGVSALTWGGSTQSNHRFNTTEQYLEGFPFNISGVITENELPVQRNIKSYERNSGELFQETYSSGVDGSYNLGTENDTDEFYVISFGRSALTSWRNSPSVNQARRDLAASVGSNSDALIAGGNATAYVDTTEKWNGSTWETTASLTKTIVGGCGVGTVVSALQCGGATASGWANRTNEAEKWNGTSWALTTSMATRRYLSSAFGDISDAIITGGIDETNTELSSCERWNGSVWATSPATNNVVTRHRCCGTTAEALLTGGYISPQTQNTAEKWNGSTWTVTTSLPQRRRHHILQGTFSSAIMGSGYTETPSATWYSSCYYWNGSVWSSTDAMNVARAYAGGAGVHGEAFVAAGYDSVNNIASCEIWSDSTPLPRFNALVWDRITAEPVP